MIEANQLSHKERTAVKKIAVAVFFFSLESNQDLGTQLYVYFLHSLKHSIPGAFGDLPLLPVKRSLENVGVKRLNLGLFSRKKCQ